jgi:capsular polysaccharide transport system permease protein
MNERAQRDALGFAQQELTRAENKVVTSQVAITSFRNRELILDPNSNSAKSLEIVSSLTGELVHGRAQIQDMLTSSPGNPSIPALRSRVAALEDQIARERGKLVGNDGALANKMSDYERLVLAREFADRELALASSMFELARQEARRQRIYIETISSPNLPDESTQPRRWRGFITILVFSSAIFAMIWFFKVGVREQLHG